MTREQKIDETKRDLKVVQMVMTASTDTHFSELVVLTQDGSMYALNGNESWEKIKTPLDLKLAEIKEIYADDPDGEQES